MKKDHPRISAPSYNFIVEESKKVRVLDGGKANGEEKVSARKSPGERMLVTDYSEEQSKANQREI